MTEEDSIYGVVQTAVIGKIIKVMRTLGLEDIIQPHGRAMPAHPVPVIPVRRSHE